MAKGVSTSEAERMLAEGGWDVVDVREPSEFAEGHVPGARNVPLGSVRSNPAAATRAARTLFVCQKGGRSQTAADLVEGLGTGEVRSLDGGTSAWERAGLPLEGVPAQPQRAAASLPADSMPPGDDACGLPPPGLDKVVGQNLATLRQARGVSLDELARQTGLARSLLGQIELGNTAPPVSVVWRLAQAFDVHFSSLLATPADSKTAVLRGADAKRLVTSDGRFSSRALYVPGSAPDAEFYELFLAAHSREDAQAHKPGTRENLIVTAGRLEMHVGGVKHELAKGDAIVFTADVPHSYVNPGSAECWMYLVMTYA